MNGVLSCVLIKLIRRDGSMVDAREGTMQYIILPIGRAGLVGHVFKVALHSGSSGYQREFWLLKLEGFGFIFIGGFDARGKL